MRSHILEQKTEGGWGLNVRYAHRDGVAELTLDRADAANSITIDMACEIREALQRFMESDAKVLIVTGRGPKSFCAGGAIETLDRCADGEHASEVGPLGFARIDPGKPTIAAINGYCFGGGLELALWCDVRIASANSSFGALNRPWGVPLIDGGTQRLSRIVGYGNAMWMIQRALLADRLSQRMLIASPPQWKPTP